MTIKDRIEALSAPNAFYYGRNYDINIQADNNEFPAIVMIEPDTLGFYFNTVAGTVKKSSQVFIRFLNMLPEGIDIAEQAEARLPVIDAMTDLAAQFVNAVMNDDDLELVVPNAGDFRIQAVTVIDAYDAHLCGVEIQLPLRLVYPEVICP